MTSGLTDEHSGLSLLARGVRVVLGPWPLRPVLLWVITLVVYQYWSGSTLASGRANVFRVILEFPVNALLAAVLVIPLAVAQLLLRLKSRGTRGLVELSRGSYLAVMVLTGVWAAGVRYIATDGSWPVDRQVLFYFIARSTVFVIAMHAVFGVADARLRRQLRIADEATALVAQQRAMVLTSEERARGAVAAFLHDHVQAGLVALMLQMRLLARNTDEATASGISAVIDEMERMRSEDVRTASRQLSPAIEDVGLATALQELSLTYRPGMQVEVDLAQAGELGGDRARALAIYRIIEQGLLNAAVHGQADEVQVSVSDGAVILVQVRDNGRGLSPEPLTRGTGTSLIDAWTGVLKGEWRLVRDGDATLLEVRIPKAVDARRMGA